MLRLNGKDISLGSFPDGTLLFKQYAESGDAEIEWFYDSDRELVALIYLTKHLRAHGVTKIRLFMPYIPNARQDRVKTAEDIFTLKYFAEILNSLGFESVTVLDPHSTVSEALINNIVILTPRDNLRRVIAEIERNEGEKPLMFYPDEGASKRYSGMLELPCAFGIKKRDWKSGKILGLDVWGDCDFAGRNVLIADDICSKGGTFFHSAKRLRELGARNIYLYISHCEKTIFDGELLTGELIKKIYTTDSICRFTHERIEGFSCKDNTEIKGSASND